MSRCLQWAFYRLNLFAMMPVFNILQAGLMHCMETTGSSWFQFLFRMDGLQGGEPNTKLGRDRARECEKEEKRWGDCERCWEWAVEWAANKRDSLGTLSIGMCPSYPVKEELFSSKLALHCASRRGVCWVSICSNVAPHVRVIHF